MESPKVRASVLPHDDRSAAYRRGAMTLVALAALTGVEYGVSVVSGSLVLMAILGLAKAGLIVHYFMHLSSLWSEESDQ